MHNNFIVPINEPYIGDLEKKLVNECMDTGWISSMGKFVDEFEKKFATYCGSNYGVSTTNGTSAIHLALKTLGIKAGDEVLVPALTFAGSVYPIIQCGATPVFIDSEMETYNLSYEDLLLKVTPKTKAIIVVHLHGHPVDMEPITKLAIEKGIWVIEDAAEAHGALFKNNKVGSIGHIGCFSFFANKILTTGEGGMLISNDKEIIQRAKQLKDFAHGEKKFIHILPEAYNYRMTNVQAAIGLGQLDRIEKTIAKKIENASLYNKLLSDIPHMILPKCLPWARHVYWVYAVQLRERSLCSRDELLSKLLTSDLKRRASGSG